MSDLENQRVPCIQCGRMALPAIIQANNGLCGRCHREAFLERKFKSRQAATPPPAPPTPTMEIRVDESHYDMQQLALIRELVLAIKSDLKQAGVSDEKSMEMTGDIAFSIAAIIDGSRVMKIAGRPLVPVLTFAEDAERTQLVARPGGSFMHEYVHGTVDELFDEDES